MGPLSGFVDEMVSSPGGVALMEALEAEHRDDVHWFEPVVESDPAAVAAAAMAVDSMSFAELARHIVSAAERIGGPWMGDAPQRLATAYALAPVRTSIATAVADRFDVTLRSELSFDAQEWWTSTAITTSNVAAMGEGRGVYCCGEFAWNSLWTVSSPPDEVHDDLIDVWEMFPGPISCWSLPIKTGARVCEVHSPSDWAQLVASYPMSTSPHRGWELPGPNHDPVHTRQLLHVSAGAAVRSGVRVAMPDWERVGDDFDGVHLSWAGKLCCEGRVIDIEQLGDDVVTMVRYWGSERTLWLNDVFGPPVPRPAPSLSGRINGDLGAEAADELRRDHDLRILEKIIGRSAL